ASNGALARLATHLRLYTAAPTKAGGGTEASGGGYAAIAISVVDWTFTPSPGVGNPMQIKLANKVWTATGTIANVAGAYITDASGNPLAWWERSGGAVTLANGDTLTADQLTIRFP
ncbi:MAG: hypothetical protein ACK4K6_18625, partial [Pseudarthrobacter sp.]